MTKVAKKTILAGVSALALMSSAATALELKSPDGFISFEGELVSFDGTMIALQTGHGLVNIPAASVECHSEDCPEGVKRAAGSVAPVAPSELHVAFDSADNRAILEGLLNAADTSTDDLTVSVSDETIELMPKDGAKTTIFLTSTDQSADINVRTLRRGGSDSAVFTDATQWAAANGTTAHQLSSESMALVVSEAAGVDALSIGDISMIYAGVVSNWSELGGNDVDILPIQVAEGIAGADSIRDTLLEPFGLATSSNVITAPNEELTLQTLAIAPGGISLVPATGTGEFAPTPVLDQCARPVLPNEFEVASGQYPLTMNVVATLNEEAASTSVANLLDVLASNATVANATDTVMASNMARSERVEAVLKGVVAEPFKESARTLVQSIFTAQRLAMTFQAGPVAEAIAANGRSDFSRLEKAILNGDLDGQEIMFFGFSTDGSDPAKSISQSKEAADTLLAAFSEFAPEAANHPGVTFSTNGYGNVGYRECDIPSVGAQSLVEVWVKPA